MSIALINIFSNNKLSLNIILMQINESIFKIILTNLHMQKELKIRQLYVFVMRNYREILQKSRRNNFLTNSISLID